jgi:P27 family predicted phage terminase small subunit
MRGRKPTPAYLKVLRGNPGNRPFAPEPEGLDGAPPMPSDLVGAAKEEWERACRELAVMNGLKRPDMAIIAIYAHCWAVWRNIMGKINLRPDPFWTETNAEGRTKILPSPLIRELRHAEIHLLRFASEIGFSPAARSRMRVEGIVGKKIDDLEDIVKPQRKLKAV